MVHVAACLLLLACVSLASAQEPAPPPREKVKFGSWRAGEPKKKLLAAGGGDAETEAAVAAALKWLAPRQQDDGTWRFDSYPSAAAASTGFALLCFFGAGYAPGDDSDYGKRQTDGVAALLKVQDAESGLIRSRTGNRNMYEHAIATQALVEAYGLTGEEKLREPCARAIELIAKAQHRDGGWRYEPAPHYAGDVSITGWVVQALTAARRANLDVPEGVLAGAIKFLNGCNARDKPGTFVYVAYGGKYNPASACTASGACSMLALGAWSRDDQRLGVAAGEILKRSPEKGKSADPYFLYYATRAVYWRGGDDWSKTWNPRMRDYLLASQKADGSWPAGGGQYGRTLGVVGTTYFHVLTLQTYYRYPPPVK